MTARVYILVNITNDNSDQVAQTLHHQPGVVAVDLLEGPPNLLMVVEAPDRDRLARLTMKVIASIETEVEDMQVLPVRDDSATATGSVADDRAT